MSGTYWIDIKSSSNLSGQSIGFRSDLESGLRLAFFVPAAVDLAKLLMLLTREVSG